MWTNQTIPKLATATKLSSLLAKVAIGSGTTTPSASDTSLASPIATANASKAKSASGNTLTIQCTATFTLSAANTIREVGLLASDDTLLWRDLVTPEVEVGAGHSVQVTVQVQATLDDVVPSTLTLVGAGTFNTTGGISTATQELADTIDEFLCVGGKRLALHNTIGSLVVSPDTSWDEAPTISGTRVSKRYRSQQAPTGGVQVGQLRIASPSLAVGHFKVTLNPILNLAANDRVYLTVAVDYAL